MRLQHRSRRLRDPPTDPGVRHAVSPQRSASPPDRIVRLAHPVVAHTGSDTSGTAAQSGPRAVVPLGTRRHRVVTELGVGGQRVRLVVSRGLHFNARVRADPAAAAEDIGGTQASFPRVPNVRTSLNVTVF